MRRWFDPKISFGTLLQLGTMIGLALLAAHKWDKRMALMESSVIAHTNALEHHQQMLSLHQDELVRMKTLLEERKRL